MHGEVFALTFPAAYTYKDVRRCGEPGAQHLEPKLKQRGTLGKYLFCDDNITKARFICLTRGWLGFVPDARRDFAYLIRTGDFPKLHVINWFTTTEYTLGYTGSIKPGNAVSTRVDTGYTRPHAEHNTVPGKITGYIQSKKPYRGKHPGILLYFFMCYHHLYFPAQHVGAFNLSNFLDKPWVVTGVFLSLPRYVPSFLPHIPEFSISTIQFFRSSIKYRLSPTRDFARSIC